MTSQAECCFIRLWVVASVQRGCRMVSKNIVITGRALAMGRDMLNRRLKRL